MIVNIFNFYFARLVWLAGLSKLERTKVAFDNLECSKVRDTGVPRWSSDIAVETELLEENRTPPNDIS